MRAIEINKPGQINLVERDEPIRKADEALIRVTQCGVCGSDVHAYLGISPNANYPLVIGHEIVGVIEAIDDSESDLKPGDRVVLNPYMSCGNCYPCSQGRYNCCQTLVCLGCQDNGAMQEKYAHPVSQLIKVPASLTDREAALIEPLVIGIHAVNTCEVSAGQYVVIIGAGTIGVMAAFAAMDRGGIPILLDLVDARLKKAQDMGIEHVFNSKSLEQTVAYLSEVTEGRMAECVIEASGSAIAVQNTLYFAAYTGIVALTGWPDKAANLETALITRKELQIRGSRTGLNSEFKEACRILESKLIPADSIVTQYVPFSELPAQIEDLAQNPESCLKLVGYLD